MFHLSGMFFKIIPGPFLITSSRGWGWKQKRGTCWQTGSSAVAEGLERTSYLSEPQFPHFKNGRARGLPVPNYIHETDFNWLFDQGFVEWNFHWWCLL